MLRVPLLACLLSALLATQPLAAAPAPQATLVVRVEGIRPAGGHLRVALFRTADGYPERFPAAARTLSVEAPAGAATATASFEGLDPGDWAVAVLHDENGNLRLDRNFLGVPREGIGASNGATRTLGVPRFGDARLALPAARTEIRIRLKYYL